MARMVYDPETGRMISQYELYLKNKNAKAAYDKEVASGGIVDMAPVEKGVIESGKMSADDFAEASMESGGVNEPLKLKQEAGSGADASSAGGAAKAAYMSGLQGGGKEDMAAAGLMAIPHPAAQAAGLALMTASAINKQKQQNRMNKYTAEVAQVKARQDAINKMAQIGQGLKV